MPDSKDNERWQIAQFLSSHQVKINSMLDDLGQHCPSVLEASIMGTKVAKLCLYHFELGREFERLQSNA